MPTGRGWSVLAGGLALLTVGLVLGYREFATLGGTATLAVLLAAAWVGRPPRLEIDRLIEPDRVRRGERCRATVSIHSDSPRTRVLNVTDFVRAPGGDRVVPAPPVRVAGGLPARTSYELPTERRGVLTVGPMRVGRRDPLGLCQANRKISSTVRVLVRPRWHELRGLPFGISPSLDGQVDAALYGNIAFDRLREYRPGDELRHVHWRISARIGTLVVREHVDTAVPRLALVVDDRAESFADDPDALEEMVEAAASVLVTTTGRAELTVMLRLASGRRWAESTAAGLDLLAEVQPVERVDLTATMHRLRQEHGGDTLVFFTSPGADLRPAVAARADYGKVVIVAIGSGAESRALPADVTLVAATGAAEFAQRWNGRLR